MMLELIKLSDYSKITIKASAKYELDREIKKYFGLKRFTISETDDNITFVFDINGVMVGKIKVSDQTSYKQYS